MSLTLGSGRSAADVLMPRSGSPGAEAVGALPGLNPGAGVDPVPVEDTSLAFAKILDAPRAPRAAGELPLAAQLAGRPQPDGARAQNEQSATPATTATPALTVNVGNNPVTAKQPVETRPPSAGSGVPLAAEPADGTDAAPEGSVGGYLDQQQLPPTPAQTGSTVLPGPWAVAAAPQSPPSTVNNPTEGNPGPETPLIAAGVQAMPVSDHGGVGPMHGSQGPDLPAWNLDPEAPAYAPVQLLPAMTQAAFGQAKGSRAAETSGSTGPVAELQLALPNAGAGRIEGKGPADAAALTGLAPSNPAALQTALPAAPVLPSGTTPPAAAPLRPGDSGRSTIAETSGPAGYGNRATPAAAPRALGTDSPTRREPVPAEWADRAKGRTFGTVPTDMTGKVLSAAQNLPMAAVQSAFSALPQSPRGPASLPASDPVPPAGAIGPGRAVATTGFTGPALAARDGLAGAGADLNPALDRPTSLPPAMAAPAATAAVTGAGGAAVAPDLLPLSVRRTGASSDRADNTRSAPFVLERQDRRAAVSAMRTGPDTGTLTDVGAVLRGTEKADVPQLANWLAPTGETIPGARPDYLAADLGPFRPDLGNQSNAGRPLAQHVAAQVATAAHIATGTQASGNSTPGTTEITLNPTELGHVRLSLNSADGAMIVMIAAERPETAELMRRHIDTLAQEFRGLGYQDVSFSFQGRQGSDGQPAFAGYDQTPGSPLPPPTPDPAAEGPADPYIPRRAAEQYRGAGLDLRL